MYIDRKLASHLLQIKRSLPYETQRDFKLSAPNIAELVYELHESTRDEQIRSCARDFLIGIGGQWSKKLTKPESDLFGRTLQQSSAIMDKMVAVISRPHTRTGEANRA